MPQNRQSTYVSRVTRRRSREETLLDSFYIAARIAVLLQKASIAQTTERLFKAIKIKDSLCKCTQRERDERLTVYAHETLAHAHTHTHTGTCTSTDERERCKREREVNGDS